MALEEHCVDCDIVVFADGSQLLDHMRKSGSGLQDLAPDLLLLDLNLPKMDGLEILQSIRETPAFATVPVAVLSSSSSTRERAQLEAFNIRTFITKPSDLDKYLEIGEIVRNLLDQNKLEPDGRPRQIE